jgi:hypothetical protein
MEEDYKAKIFISCGQRDEQEKDIARNLSFELSNLGFFPYVAVYQQSLEDLKRNIFFNIESSEYFIFIDFKREKIGRKFRRGSLFSHQELALASYVKMPLIAFQEDGVIPNEGVLGFLQGNCEKFSSRGDLVQRIIEKVKRENWKPNWKKQLRIKIDDLQPYVDTSILLNNGTFSGHQGRFFHLKVINPHITTSARNCAAYLLSVRNKEDKKTKLLELAELKWTGYHFPNVLIPSQNYRKLDAFWVNHSNPDIINMNLLADYTGFYPVIKGPNTYILEYMIVSDNFPTIKYRMNLDVGTTINDIRYSISKVY